MIGYIFLDGIGYGKQDESMNPFTRYAKKFFRPLGGYSSVYKDATYLKIDASMGIKGLPQSATGQTALWTGIRAPFILNKHISGYPSITLRKIIQKYSVIKIMNDYGYKATFINCYSPKYLEYIEKKPKLKSASTLVQLAAGKELHTLNDLRNGNGIYMDITHKYLKQMLKNQLSTDDPLLNERDPYKVGKQFCEIVSNYDLSIYEFFLTDKIGHDQNWEKAEEVIDTIESFIEGIMDNFPKDKGQIILSSDHGNLEDLSTGTHTTNLVPCFLYGKYTDLMKESIHELSDIVPAIYSIYNIDCKPEWEALEE
jgi:hypothetical protein